MASNKYKKLYIMGCLRGTRPTHKILMAQVKEAFPDMQPALQEAMAVQIGFTRSSRGSQEYVSRECLHKFWATCSSNSAFYLPPADRVLCVATAKTIKPKTLESVCKLLTESRKKLPKSYLPKG